MPAERRHRRLRALFAWANRNKAPIPTTPRIGTCVAAA
jgi:hypothetical protein